MLTRPHGIQSQTVGPTEVAAQLSSVLTLILPRDQERSSHSADKGSQMLTRPHGIQSQTVGDFSPA